MAKSLTLKITQKIIDDAVSKNSAHCMIAQAARMAGASSTNVTAEAITFNMGDMRYTYPLPARAAAELVKFDKNKKLAEPFQFTLDGRTAFERPVKHNPNAKKRGPTKKRAKPTAKRSVRRFHGLRVIEVSV